MKRIAPWCVAFLFAAACSPREKGPANNPIDEVMEPRFEAEEISPEKAGDLELCRRLSADLLGRFHTLEEVEAQCAGRSLEAVIRDFQSRDEYQIVSERHWRDRFDTTDVTSDWRQLKELYAMVGRMHRGQVGYREFAVEAMSHPGFIASEFQPADKVRAVFEAFMGRTPTDSEAADLAALYRPWLPAQGSDPDFSYIYRLESRILPVLCEPISSCTSSMFGGGMLDLSGFDDPNYQGIAYDDLTEAQKDVLREPGRVLTAQPFFWEAAADEILNRYLGWSDGGRFPREPGIVLPEVREALARYLRETGNYPAAERVVLTSWLYRMKSTVPDDGFGNDPLAPVPEIYAHGPVKPAQAEVWLDSTAALSIDLGACDPRYSDGFPYFLIIQAAQDGVIAQSQLTSELRRMWELQASRLPWNDAEGRPDFTYQFVARLIGGCPGFANQRQAQTGLSYAFTQETLAELLCNVDIGGDLAPEGEFSLGRTVEHQIRLAYGRPPVEGEVADFESAYAGCDGAECTPAGIMNSVCVGLLGSAEMIFY